MGFANTMDSAFAEVLLHSSRDGNRGNVLRWDYLTCQQNIDPELRFYTRLHFILEAIMIHIHYTRLSPYLFLISFSVEVEFRPTTQSDVSKL